MQGKPLFERRGFPAHPARLLVRVRPSVVRPRRFALRQGLTPMPTRRSLSRRPLFALAVLPVLAVSLAVLPARADQTAAQATAQATPQAGAAAGLIRSLVSEVIDALNRRDMSQGQKIAGFRSLLERYFDVPAIGRSVLGRYWPMATPDQQKEYLTLFEQTVFKVYADRFSQYSG